MGRVGRLALTFILNLAIGFGVVAEALFLLFAVAVVLLALFDHGYRAEGGTWGVAAIIEAALGAVMLFFGAIVFALLRLRRAVSPSPG
jgi:hypothetical protein